MKTQLKQKTMIIAYWSCYDTLHSHRNKDAAERCIEAREIRKTALTQADLKYKGTFKGLPARIRNALHADDIISVGELVSRYNDGSIKKIPNVGKLSISLILRWLEKHARHPTPF